MKNKMPSVEERIKILRSMEERFEEDMVTRGMRFFVYDMPGPIPLGEKNPTELYNIFREKVKSLPTAFLTVVKYGGREESAYLRLYDGEPSVGKDEESGTPRDDMRTSTSRRVYPIAHAEIGLEFSNPRQFRMPVFNVPIDELFVPNFFQDRLYERFIADKNDTKFRNSVWTHLMIESLASFRLPLLVPETREEVRSNVDTSIEVFMQKINETFPGCKMYIEGQNKEMRIYELKSNKQ